MSSTPDQVVHPAPSPAPDASPASPAAFVKIEAAALSALAFRMEGSMFSPIQTALAFCVQATAAHQAIVFTGIGKSGIIARKLAATFRSTGSPAHFLHPSEAQHGDLGLLTPSAPVIALSYSGETEELLALLPAFSRLACPLIAFTGCAGSTLARAAALVLDISVDAEACPHNLAPTASTTVMLALGDALALELSRRANFQPTNFADLHPGGKLGRRLARVRDLMHSGDALPAVSPSTSLPALIHEMSRKKLGMTTVLDPGQRLAGIIVDGDLRRLLEKIGPQALQRTAMEIMNAAPQTVGPGAFASEALASMEARKITALVVVEEEQVVGVVHLHDLLNHQLPTAH